MKFKVIMSLTAVVLMSIVAFAQVSTESAQSAAPIKPVPNKVSTPKPVTRPMKPTKNLWKAQIKHMKMTRGGSMEPVSKKK